jgi:hypothetical protein
VPCCFFVGLFLSYLQLFTFILSLQFFHHRDLRPVLRSISSRKLANIKYSNLWLYEFLRKSISKFKNC